MKKLVLAGIVILGFLLRIVWLDKFPVGFTPDEASFGYDAYSILKTGRDQWGHFLPLQLESFGDFKSPLYAYLTVPFVAVLGLTKTAVRLPNAILGSFAVVVVYFLAKELLFTNPPSRSQSPPGRWLRFFTSDGGRVVALVAAFFLAISPWHIQLSRGAFEANLTTFFLPLGVFLFIKGINSISKGPTLRRVGPCGFLVASAIVFGLNLFTYHSAKVVTPLIVFVLVVIFYRELKQVSFKYLLIPSALFVIFMAIMSYTFFTGGGVRAKDLSISNGSLEAAAKIKIELINQGTNPILAKLLHNKFQYTAQRFINNYIQYFSLKFLFKEGPKEATYGMIPGRGVLYLIELPILVGFIFFAIKNYKNRIVWFLLFWMLIAFIPVALSTGVGYAGNRSAIVLPALPIALSLGGFYLKDLIEKLSKQTIRIAAPLFFIILLMFVLSFIRDYFLFSPRIVARDMLYGNFEISDWLKENVVGQTVLVSKSLSEPQMYIAFANSWDPADYQKNTSYWNYKSQGVNWVDQMGKYSLGNYTFKSIDWKKDEGKYDYFVGKPDEFPTSVLPFYIINYPDGNPAIEVLKGEAGAYAKN